MLGTPGMNYCNTNAGDRALLGAYHPRNLLSTSRNDMQHVVLSETATRRLLQEEVRCRSAWSGAPTRIPVAGWLQHTVRTLFLGVPSTLHASNRFGDF